MYFILIEFVVFQAVCNGLGAHVVFVDDSAEDDFIMELTKASRNSELLL